MATLSEVERQFIVTELAQFQEPSEVVESVNERFGIDVSRQQVQHYDPTVGRKPADRWKELFEATRRTYLEDTSRVAIAHRGYRVRRLQAMADKAEEMGNYPLAKEIMEQAAKEMGGKFTNRHLFDVDPKGALAQVMGVSPDELPDEIAT